MVEHFKVMFSIHFLLENVKWSVMKKTFFLRAAKFVQSCILELIINYLRHSVICKLSLQNGVS